jgi:hypothetical protein
MAISARVPAGADTAGFVPEIYTQEVCDAVENELVCWQAFDTSSGTGMKKGDTFFYGVINNVTATEVTIGNKANSLDHSTGTKITLSIDQFWEAPIDVDTMTSGQSQVSLETYAKKKGAYAIAKKIDTTVNALFYGLGGYTASGYGSDGQEFTDDIMLYLYETLRESDVPWDSDISLIADPSTLIDMLKWDKIVATNYANNVGSVTSGKIGKNVYGAMVRITNNLTAATTGAYGVLAHKDAIKGIMQLNAPWVKPFEELHEVRYQHEALWGVCEYRDTFGIPFYTRKK